MSFRHRQGYDMDVADASEVEVLLTNPPLHVDTGSRKSPASPHPALAGTVLSPRTTKSRLLHGLVLLLLVNLIWVAASELLQSLHFSSPIFITYVSNTLFVVLFPVSYTADRVSRLNCIAKGKGPLSSVCAPPPRIPGAYSLKQTAAVSLVICPMWFLAQGSYNYGLTRTSVSSSTILSSTSSVFTLGLSAWLLKERVTWIKLLGVAAAVAGAVCVGLADSDDKDTTVVGDALCLFSALMYGLYTTFIRKLVPEDLVRMTHFFGFLGSFNGLLLWPLVLILHFTGVEDLSHLTATILGWVVLKGLADNVLSDWLWAHAILLTSPTIATVALSLTIPLSMFADWMVKGLVPSLGLVAGSVLVTAGFVAVNLGADEYEPPGASPQRPAGGIGGPANPALTFEEMDLSVDDNPAPVRRLSLPPVHE